MFNCSTGTPPYPHEDGGVSYREIARACKFARDGGYDALLGLHEYEPAPDMIGRFKVLADCLEDYRALIPIVITEYGYETYPGSAQHMAMLTRNDPLYMSDERVIGCADWTLGGGGWAGSNYERDLPAMADYIANVAPVEVEPPPIEPPPVVEPESPNNAACAFRDYLIDSFGAAWSLRPPFNPDAGYVVMRDGEQYAGGLAECLRYVDSSIQAINSRSEVYVATAAGWEQIIGGGR